MRMKKILIIRTFPSVLDPKGYNIQEIGFAKALVKAGLICDVVLYNGKNQDEEKTIEVFSDGQKVGNVKVYMRHGFGILKNGFFPGLRRIAKEYDILQVHEYDQITSWMYYAWNKKKQIVIYHGPYYDSYNKGYNLKCGIFDKVFLTLKSGKNTLCFTKSKAAARFLEGKGFKSAVPIGVGLDIENFADESGGQLEMQCPVTEKIKTTSYESISTDMKGGEDFVAEQKDCWRILYVGKIEPRRNSMLLLDILEELSKQRDDICMTVIGSGDKAYLEEWMKKAEPLMYSGVLTYIRKMEQKDLRAMYCQSDIMIFPSNYEIFGMVLLEAMFFNLPVISSDNGGSDTLIRNGENGIVVEDFSVQNWVDAIIKMHDDAGKYGEIKKCLEETDHNIYTWDGIAKEYIKELELEK